WFQKVRVGYGRKPGLPLWLQRVHQKLATWFQLHPKMWYATAAVGALGVLLIAFITFIYSQTPSQKELTTIRNAVASEVYSADSVLLGRYYIQDRTEVKFE